MKKLLSFLLLTLQLGSCQNHNNNSEQNKDQNFDMHYFKEYEWGVAVNTPIGYPIRFYAAMVGRGFIMRELYSGTKEPDWGSALSNEGTSNRTLPKDVDMVWLSYKEDCFYSLKTTINYEKVEKLFREGYKERASNGTIRHTTYDTVVVGLAPGGVVVLWIGKGYKKITEIGRYQAKKIDLREPPGLDDHERLIFSKEDREETLNSDLAIPKAVREANKNKPIPFGLWDSYRDNQYQWYPTFEIPNGRIGDVDYQYWNGEADTFFFTDFIALEGQKDVFAPQELYHNIRKLPLFKEIRFTYKAEDGIKYGVLVQFEWEGTLATYKKVFGEHPEEVKAHLDIRINRINSYLTVRLMGDNGKEAFIEPKLIDIGEANQEYAPPFDN